MPGEVKCMVEECNHNQNKSCHADSIEVRSNGGKKVNSTGDTCCGTFKP